MKKVLGLVCSVALVLVVLYPNLYLGVLQASYELDGVDARVDPSDPLVQLVGQQLRLSGESPESWVARSIRWESDYAVYGNLEYWASPGETILAGRGDCEDRAILTSSLNRYLGQESAIVVQLDHVYVLKDGEAYFGVSDTESVPEALWGLLLGIPLVRKLCIVAGLALIWAAVLRA